MTIALRPLRPVRPLLRKDADQLGLFGDVTPVKLTPKAKARAKLYGNVAAPVVPKPKAAPKPTATPGKKPKEGDTRTNRAGNKEVLRGGRWRLADNPQVIAKDKPAAIVPVVEDLREADLVDEALPQVMPEDEPEITLEDLQEPGEEAPVEAGEMAGEEKLIAPKTSSSYWHGISRDALTGAGIEEVFKRATGLDADEKHIKLLLSTAAKDGTSLWELPDDSVSSSKNKGIGMRHFELKGFVAFDRPSQRFFITSKGIKAVKDYYKEKSKLLGTDSYADNDPVDDIDPLSRIKAKREIDEIERIKADEQAKARLAEGPKVPDLDVFGKRVANSIRQKLDDYGMAEGDLPIDLWQAIEYAKHDRGLSWPRAVDWAMSRRAKPTPEPTPEPMPEEAGGMAGEAPKPVEDAIQFDTTAEPLTKKQDVMNLAEQVSEKIKGTQVSLTLEGGLKYDVTIAGAKVLDLGKGQYLVAARISEGKITRANGSTRDLTGTLDPQIARNIYTTAVGLPLDSIRGGKMTAYRVDGIGGITATGKILTTAGSAKKVKFDLGRQAVDYPLRAEPEPMLEEAGEMAGKDAPVEAGGKTKKKWTGEFNQRRAKAGGEYGPNNEWYEGGKFIPHKDKPKVLGSKKGSGEGEYKPKGRAAEEENKKPKEKTKPKRPPGSVEIAPDEYAVRPEGMRSIYLFLGGRFIKSPYTWKDKNVMEPWPYEEIAKALAYAKVSYDEVLELVDRWNKGERFFGNYSEQKPSEIADRFGAGTSVGGGDGSESAGDGVSGRSGGFSGKDRLPDMEPAKVEVGTYSPILRYPPREQKGKRQWVDMAKQHTPEDWRRIGDFFEGKLKNLGSEEIPMTMGEFQSDFSNEDIKDHLNLVQGTITARKVQKYPDFARAMNLMELYAGLHPQMKFIIWPRPESRYAAYPDDSPSAKPKTENDQHMRRLLRLMNEALDTPGRERVTLPDRTVQRRSPAPSLQAPPGFRVNKFGGVASDGTQVAAGEGYIRNEDGRWKIYSKDQVDSDGNILTKSLRPYPGPYLTLLGVRYILDRGILRKAARKSTLNTGDTKTVNGVTYTFNENRRWARADKKAKTPRAKATPKAARPPVASIPILEETPKVKGKPRGMKPKTAPNAQVEGASKQARRGVARSVSAEGLKPKAKPTQLKPKAGASPEAKPEASQGIVLAKKDNLTAKPKGKPKGKQKAKAADVDSRYATANPTDEQAKNFLKDKTDEFLGDPKSDRKEAIKEVHDRFKKTKVKDEKTYVQAVLRNQEISIENWDRDGQSWMADNKSKIKRVESRLTDAKTDKARKRAQLDLDKLLQEKTELEAGLRNIEELRKKPQEQRIAEAEQRYEQDIKQSTQDRANRRAAYQRGDKKVVSEVNREVRSNLIRPMLDDPEFEDYIPARNILTGRVEQPSVLEQAKAYLRLVHRSGGGDASALGLDTAKPSLEELRRAYRKKAVEAHPDQGGSREAFEAVRDSYERLMKKHYPDLLKSLQSGPYVTLLGVRYILDGGILRKAGMSWEDFRCEAEAMHKEAQGDDDPCWKGYEAVGLKRKGKRMVPNCVPASR